jgi:hypothetical protein
VAAILPEKKAKIIGLCVQKRPIDGVDCRGPGFINNVPPGHLEALAMQRITLSLLKQMVQVLIFDAKLQFAFLASLRAFFLDL